MTGTRVLIVEDDQAVASVIEQTLQDAGIESTLVTNGHDAVWMAREGGFGAIVLDILLPGLNGYEVCRTLRSEGDHTAVLMLTSKGGEYDETDGFEMGADDYLRKPFSTAVLAHRVKALLRRTPGTVVLETIRRGGVEFDLATRRCRSGDHKITLTAREATLLEALLRSGDTPLSRRQLLRDVWGPDFDGDPNVVDVYLGYLRRKLGKDRVENLRGVGFRIAP